MNIQKTFAAAFIGVLIGSTALYADDMRISAPSVPMVSGGIGDGGIDKITALQKDYSVKLIFSEPSGEYLADVDVQIRDHNKNVVVDAASQGPIVLINLKPGTYTLVSTVTGETKTQRIQVKSDGLSTYSIHLHSTES